MKDKKETTTEEEKVTKNEEEMLYEEEETTEGEREMTEEEEEMTEGEREIRELTEKEFIARIRTKRVKCCVCMRDGKKKRRKHEEDDLIHHYYDETHYYPRRRRCCCCRWWCLLTMMLVNLILVLMVLTWWDVGVHVGVLKTLSMTEGSQKDEMWRTAQISALYTVRIFNLTNPSQFMAGGRPTVQEVGPYVYTMKELKENVVYHDDGSVQYQGRPMYFFQPHLSSGSEEDMVTTVNIPFINAADMVKDQEAAKTVMKMIKKLYGFDTLRRLSVRELLWGHQSRVLDWARTIQDLPYPHQQFGLLLGLNNTLQPPYLMHTGKGDPSKMNRILAWDGHEVLHFWYGDVCNMIRGTDANGFRPGISKSDMLYIFNGQLCRSLPLVYNSTVTNHGLEAYRFVHPDNIFNYGHANPENHCFCGKGGCPSRGILDMKPCYFGASIGFSFPHFYKGHPRLRHMVHGMRPDPKKHRTEFDIYPDLGVPLRVKLRMQMNVMLDSNQALERARHFDVVLPIFWFEVGVDSLPGEVVGLLKLAQNLPPVVKTTSVTLCTALTLIFLILLLAQTVAAWCGWGSAGARKRPHTPDDLPHHTHYRPSPPLWEYDELQKPPRRGDSIASSSSYKDSLTPTLPHRGVDIPIIDDHTLLPPYRRTHNQDIPDSIPHLECEVNESIDADQVPPPYSPGPPLRTPSTVSVEIHITASDDELPDLPLDLPIKNSIPLEECPPDYEQETQLSPDEEEDDEKEEPDRVTPTTPPPLPGEHIVAPLARGEDTLDLEGNSESSHPPPPPDDPPAYSESPTDPGKSPSPKTTAPLATSSPQGSDGSNNTSHSKLPPPLESDL
ncbi:scavenger receptor class B member 1-like isoform X1 [Homarus americanus]|uniref:scavenger receptor class B member 1-like isoform X1 n=1 Tax=Homarus americanus TaxID=6706 RepID=UPI001C4755A4|nr:scavenger receptor class B member 1-like isoform X1 [Homarus americanus]